MERYKTVLAMLSDPVNYAIAQREVLKNRKSIITPPIPRDGGFVFVRAMDWPCYDEEELDIVAEVFGTDIIHLTAACALLLYDDLHGNSLGLEIGTKILDLVGFSLGVRQNENAG